LRLLVENRFPAIWLPSAGNQEQRQLLLHRCRLVRMRTRIKNQLDSIAKNEGLTGSQRWSAKRLQQVENFPKPEVFRLDMGSRDSGRRYHGETH
jgi:hypothetical protein